MKSVKIYRLRESDLVVPLRGPATTYVPHMLPFACGHGEVCLAGGILAPISGTMRVDARQDVTGWEWTYHISVGPEWEYTVRDEAREVQDRAFAEFIRRGAMLPSQTWPRATSSPDDTVVAFSFVVDRLASSPFPGATLAKMMHDAYIPVVVLQNQVIGPAWGSLTITAKEDLDGWVLHYEWRADDGWGSRGDRVAGQDAIDSWRRRAIAHAVDRYWHRHGRTLRAEIDGRAMWEKNWPATTTDDMGRIVDSHEGWPVDEDDDGEL